MNRTDQIQEKLKELPKPSLTEVQKQRVMTTLKTTNRSPRRKTYLRPVFAVLAACMAFFLLVMTEFPKVWDSIQGYFEPQTELNAPKAEIFHLKNDNAYEVTGIKDKVAIFGKDSFVAEDKRRSAKMFIYFWGDPETLIYKNYRVEATNRQGEELTLSEGELNHGLYNEDAMAMTSFPPFPTEGKWQLSFYVEDRLHGQFTLDVLPPYLKTEHYTVLHYSNKLEAGETISAIEGVKDTPEITVELINTNGDKVGTSTFVKDGEVIDSDTGERIYFFRGSLTLPTSDTLTLVINGEKTKTFGE
ncbi:hypothetical protein [Pseudalkalibacillus sp. SCS-8]|uniref:hypothetical protein n=1 Tax=Pseudalkalibacillus nanhaiensis TaxID=3115291 RepID=UPI0032DBA518